MNDVEQLDDDNLPAEELFMSGLFRARLPLSDGEWSDVLTVAEVSLTRFTNRRFGSCAGPRMRAMKSRPGFTCPRS